MCVVCCAFRKIMSTHGIGRWINKPNELTHQKTNKTHKFLLLLLLYFRKTLYFAVFFQSFSCYCCCFVFVFVFFFLKRYWDTIHLLVSVHYKNSKQNKTYLKKKEVGWLVCLFLFYYNFLLFSFYKNCFFLVVAFCSRANYIYDCSFLVIC